MAPLGSCHIEAELKSFLLSFLQGEDLSLDKPWSPDILVRLHPATFFSAVSTAARFAALAARSFLTAQRKQFVSRKTMRSPGLVLAASQDDAQET